MCVVWVEGGVDDLHRAWDVSHRLPSSCLNVLHELSFTIQKPVEATSVRVKTHGMFTGYDVMYCGYNSS